MIVSCHFCKKLCRHKKPATGWSPECCLECVDCRVYYKMQFTHMTKVALECDLNQKLYTLELNMDTKETLLFWGIGVLRFDFLMTGVTPQNVAEKVKTLLVFS